MPIEDCVEITVNKTIDLCHSRYRRHSATPEDIAEFAKDALGVAVVNIGIGSVQIAGRSLEPIGLGLQNEPGVAARV